MDAQPATYAEIEAIYATDSWDRLSEYSYHRNRWLDRAALDLIDRGAGRLTLIEAIWLATEDGHQPGPERAHYRILYDGEDVAEALKTFTAGQTAFMEDGYVYTSSMGTYLTPADIAAGQELHTRQRAGERTVVGFGDMLEP